MVRFKVLTGFSLGGGRDLSPGQEFDPAEIGRDAAWLRARIGMGWIAPLPEGSPAPEPEADEELPADQHPTGGELESNAPDLAPPKRGRKPRGESGP